MHNDDMLKEFSATTSLTGHEISCLFGKIVDILGLEKGEGSIEHIKFMKLMFTVFATGLQEKRILQDTPGDVLEEFSNPSQGMR